MGELLGVGVVCHEQAGEPSNNLKTWEELLPGCRVSLAEHGQDIACNDALILTSCAALPVWVREGMANRLVDATERFLAGGRPVVACGTAALALFGEVETPADSDAPDAATFWADRSVTEANPWRQWPGVVAAPLDSKPRTLTYDQPLGPYSPQLAPSAPATGTRPSEQKAADQVGAWLSLTPAPAGSIRHWEWADDSPLFRPPQVTWFEGDPRAVAVVRNGPLTAVLGDAADSAVRRFVAGLVLAGCGR